MRAHEETEYRCSDPLTLVKLDSLMAVSSGRPEIAIGLIDGPIDIAHTAFKHSKIRTVHDFQYTACRNADSFACMHGTFIAGILCAPRELSIPGICPSCEILLYPIFDEKSSGSPPSITPKELADAIIQTVQAGARIINLSMELSLPYSAVYPELQEAYTYALKQGVIVVAAAGNQGSIGHMPLLNHSWLIPVGACDNCGRPALESNFGPSIGVHGLMAPGVNVKGISSRGQLAISSGTSIASAFVSGSIALLWSIFPFATSLQILQSVRRSSYYKHRSIIPPLLNAKEAWETLKKMH